MKNPALAAYVAWVRAGRPGPNPQLALFDSHYQREVVQGRRRDRPRRRKR